MNDRPWLVARRDGLDSVRAACNRLSIESPLPLPLQSAARANLLGNESFEGIDCVWADSHAR